jgi:tRNA threonylcarbamoyladenosine biosynthesis protein TsaB
VNILAIDAATYSGSVALVRDGVVVGEAEAEMRGQHEERLMPAVASVLEGAALPVSALNAVACGAGPGSFTSLRIAASIAKGIAASLEIPMYAAASTLLVVAGAEPALTAGRYIVALDAMRGEFFVHEVSVTEGGGIIPGSQGRASRAALESHALSIGAVILGPAESRSLAPRAAGFAALLRQHIAMPIDLAAWEPDYGRKAEAQVRWEAEHGRELEV